MGQSKEIMQNWMRSKTFDICSSQCLVAMTKSLFVEGRPGKAKGSASNQL